MNLLKALDTFAEAAFTLLDQGTGGAMTRLESLEDEVTP